MTVADQLRHMRRLGQLVRLGGWSVSVPDHKVRWSDEVCEIHEVEHGHDPTLEGGLSFYTPEWRERVRTAFLACAERGEPIDEVVEIITAKGNRRWGRTIGEAVRNADGAIVEVQGGFQDVTSLKEAESERNRLERRLTESFNSMSDAVIMLDRDWRFTFVNRRAETLLNKTAQDLVGRNMWDAFPEGRGTVAEAAYEKVMSQGGSATFELDYSPIGRWLDVNVFATDNGLAAYFHDTTERHRTQALLQEALERFRLVTQATADVVWDWNLVTDAIWWSEGMRTLFGYDIAALPPGSTSWTRALHPEDRDRVLHSIHAAMNGDSAEWQDEYRFMRADSSCAQVIDRGFIIRHDGKAVRMVGSMNDVTRQRELEAQLRQAQRLDAIGQLTGGVAHDFNNLLTVVLGNAELLESRLAHEPKLRAVAEMTRLAAERGAELTSRLLAFSRRQPLDPKPIDVGAQITRMGDLLRRVLGDHIEIDIQRDEGLWPALVDAPQLESAVLNLSINARDAMPDSGQLTIALGNVSVTGANADGAPAGDFVLVNVTDSGTGMDADTLAHAFEPFFTTKEVGKGSGLGLSMVYGFATQSKGHVKIRSILGEGTSVRLYLPRADATPDSDFEIWSDDRELPRGHQKVLIVEDDDLVRAQVTAELEALGYAVVSVASGPSALEALRAAPDFDLLFTDVVLPGGMNGRQLADSALTLRPGLRVLFTSGYAEDVIVHHGRVDPGFQLLRKPYRRRDLALQLRRALGASA